MSETTRANEKIHGVKVRDYISALEQITISDDDEDEPENEYPEFDERQHNFVTQTLYSGSKHDVRMKNYFEIKF